MSSCADLILKKPVSILNAEVDLDFKGFFASLGKAAVAGSFGDLQGALEYGIDALAETGLLESPEQTAWILVSSSLKGALVKLVKDYRDLFITEPDETALEELAERVEYTLDAVVVTLDKNFFNHPQDLQLLADFKSAVVFWLKGLGLEKHQTQAFYDRLKIEFVLALHEEWSKNSEAYKPIEKVLDTPFSAQTLIERSWKRYRIKLQSDADQRVFGEAFGLRQVYIPLRAYYKNTLIDDLGHDSGEVNNVVCDLHTDIEEWLLGFDKNNSLRVVSGGPGSGKSSFAKVLAADLAEANEIPVIFIPLHYFNMTGNLIDAIGKFVRPDQLGNPLVDDSRRERLLLIFDGLDELSMQGKAANDAALQFVDELSRVLDRHNNNGSRWQAIVTGRDLSVQASQSRLRELKQILHVLPYHIVDDEKSNYIDEAGLLELDQRNLWWDNFSKAKELGYRGLPSELATNHLQPITREPLLNYLLSLSYERKIIAFNDQTSLNTIYFDLLNAVHQRQYAGYQHDASKHLTFNEFLEILEEIALAVWHGNGRTASESYLLQRCEQGGLTRHLESFSDGAKKGVVRLLTAFYFRQFGTESSGDRTFEFTHKSFGEYLTSRRIVGAMDTICEELRRNKESPRKGWTTQKALEEWIKATGPTRMDSYLFEFVKNEISRFPIKVIGSWQATISELLGIVVRVGSPMENIGLSNFSSMLEQSVNAEEALIVIHHCCTIRTKKVSAINWGARTNFGTWLKKISGQRSGPGNSVVFRALTNINFNDQALDMADLYCADLSNSNLSNSSFYYTTLQQANLLGADLKGALMQEANLQVANLQGAHLQRANLQRANLQGAELEGANLEGANLERANLEGANLERAHLQRANLQRANLQGANLEGANLEGANLEGAVLEEAVLEEAHVSPL